MARKPVTELAGGKGLRQRIWERIRALPKHAEFGLRDVITGVEAKESARDYLLSLEKGGFLAVAVEPTKVGNVFTAKRWRLARDVGLEAPRVKRDGSPVTQGLAQEQMWRTLRMTTCDTNARELAAHASTPSIPVAEVAAKDYLKTLFTAGYLERTAEGKGTGAGGIQARYRLKRNRNTGPRPPMVCRTKVVYDPNEDKVVWQPRVTDEDAIHGQ